MGRLTRWVDYWNERVRQLSIWDFKLAQLWTAGFVLITVKLFPQIMQVSIWWFVLLLMLCAPRLLYVFWFRKSY
ncbi:MAG: hypothetical protein ACYS0H_24405 [Planctomycetota bacterium]|jgi:hypothetical protein